MDEGKSTDLVPVAGGELGSVRGKTGMPPMILEAGQSAAFAYEEFFRAEVESDHTYRAYRRAVDRFLAWCEERGCALREVSPALVGDYLRGLKVFKRVGNQVFVQTDTPASKPTKKLHLAALRKFFDRLVVRHAVVLNPAASVKAPKYAVQEGKTPALSVEQVRALLRTIDISHIVGLRDRAVIATLVYTGARVGAVAKLHWQDFYQDGNQWWLDLDEKGGKARQIPVRHDLQTYYEEYFVAAGLSDAPEESPLFRSTVRKTKVLTENAMTDNDILRMVKRRLKDAKLPTKKFSCHSFRATTITDLLEQGVPLEDVQYLAGHADPRTTRLYDRRKKEVTRNIVERISV